MRRGERPSWSVITVIACAAVLAGCQVLQQYESIQDITFHPEAYEGTTVRVKGIPSTAFSLSGGHDFLYDKYQNQLRVLPSCGDFINYLGTDREYVAVGIMKNGSLDCFAPVYLEGNEPPMIQERLAQQHS